MQIVALCDANVLYASTLRDFLLRLALEGVFQIHTTEQILDEAFDNLRANRPDISPQRLQRTRSLMIKALPTMIVTDYEDQIEQIQLPDSNDRHVLAVAIVVGADVVVTSNLRDFPAAILSPYGILAQEPDEFLLGLHVVAAHQMTMVVHDMAGAWRAPTVTAEDVLDSLAKQAPRTAEQIRSWLHPQS